MITVYVWKPRVKAHHPRQNSRIGHASMAVDGPHGKAYISWWPAGGNLVDKGYCGVKPVLHGSLREDIDAEGHVPDEHIPLDGLDEGKILAYWRSWSTHGKYSGARHNCATTVGTALLLGDGHPHAILEDHRVWIPFECAHLARHILHERTGKGGH